MGCYTNTNISHTHYGHRLYIKKDDMTTPLPKKRGHRIMVSSQWSNQATQKKGRRVMCRLQDGLYLSTWQHLAFVQQVGCRATLYIFIYIVYDPATRQYQSCLNSSENSLVSVNISTVGNLLLFITTVPTWKRSTLRVHGIRETTWYRCRCFEHALVSSAR